MEYNVRPISIRDGKIIIDGVEAGDSVSASGVFTPDTWSGKQLGDKSNSTRWLGYNITVALTRHRSNPWIKEVIKKYKDTGKTPEITIQGIMCDGDSDFFDKYGNDVCTFVGCVPTGAMPLTSLDSNGDVVVSGLRTCAGYYANSVNGLPEGVFAAVKGFESGWMDLTGQWLYAESIFASSNDEMDNGFF